MQKADPVAIVGSRHRGLTAALCLARQGSGRISRAGRCIGGGRAGLQLSPNASRNPHRTRLAARSPNASGMNRKRSRLPTPLAAAVPACLPAHAPRERWGAPLRRPASRQPPKDPSGCRPGGTACRRHLETASRDDPPASHHRSETSDHRQRSSVRTVSGRGYASLSPAPAPFVSRANVAWRFTLSRTGRPPACRLIASPPSSRRSPSRRLSAHKDRRLQPRRDRCRKGVGRNLDGARIRRSPARVRGAFRDWHPDLRALLGHAGSPTYWPLCTVEDGPGTMGATPF